MRTGNLLAYAITAVAISAVSLISPALPELAVEYDVSVSEVAAIQVAVLMPGLAAPILGLTAVLLAPMTAVAEPRPSRW